MYASSMIEAKGTLPVWPKGVSPFGNQDALWSALSTLRASMVGGDLSVAQAAWNDMKSSVFISTTAVISRGRSSDEAEYLQTVSLLREILELACIVYLELEDIPGFNKCFTVLYPFYTDFAQPTLPQSTNEAPLTAIHLLCLVALGRLGELQVFLQRLPEEVRKHNDVTYVVEVEKYFTVGNYEKCIEAVLNPPNKFLKLICKSLMDSIRIQVADILRKSHQRISIQRATKLLLIDNRKELEAFVAKMNVRGAAADKQTFQEDEVLDETEIRGDEVAQRPDVYSWEITDDHIAFTTVLDNRKQIPVQELTNYVLNYAAELERIV